MIEDYDAKTYLPNSPGNSAHREDMREGVMLTEALTCLAQALNKIDTLKEAGYISKSEFSQFIAEKNKLLAFSDAQKQLLDETVWAIREALGKLQKAS